MDEIKEMVELLAEQIAAPIDYLPTYNYSEDFARPHIEMQGNEYHLLVIEKGQEIKRQRTYDIEELIYWIFDSVTFEMALRLEVLNRNEEEDFRIQLFKIQEDLIEKINPKYKNSLEVKHRKLLQI